MFLVGALILLAIIFVAAFASKWRVPLVVISLVAGMLFGSGVLNIVPYPDYGFARQLADAALVFVLFVGGFSTCDKRFKAVFAPAMILATIGVIGTAAITGSLLYFLLNFPWQVALLVGCIIASTDAAAIFSILRTRSLDPNMSALVEIESATNDPMAIVLTTIAISIVITQGGGGDHGQGQYILIALKLVWQTVGGIGIGLLIGWFACRASKYVAELDKGYFYVYIVAIIMLSFGIADLCKASGILSAFFAGFMLGNSNISFKSTTTTFLESLSTMGNVVIFVLLGLLVLPSEFGSVYKDGIVLFLILTFIARPVVVAVCTFFARYGLREHLFMNWSGLRGAVPMVLATYPLAAGIEGARYIFNIVFFAVFLSMAIQGSTITKLADKLKLATKAKPKPKQVMELVAMHHSDLELVEMDIDDSIYGGSEPVPISSFNLPAGTTVTMVNRNDKIIAPTGKTEIFPGDILYVLVKISEVDNATAAIRGRFSSKNTQVMQTVAQT
ncbi:MAG: potassium/proton antiporter [Chitinispirillales bacterium]|jgi:cell volume regulation protein A|nr:potassium/proton antiporter [Chitinispirillales bacterium]